MSAGKSERRKKPPPSIPVRIARTLGLAFGIVACVYLYQPQRYDFFPRPAPFPNQSIDPDSAKLFSSKARVLVVAAHPDDPEYYIGGTLLKLRRAGAQIAIVMCTDGDKGYYPWFMTNATMNRIVRRREQIDAASHYNATVYFLAEPDGRLRANASVIGKVDEAIKGFRPNFLLAFDPEYPPRIQHSDHLQSGVAAIEAAKGNPNIQWILRFATHASNHVVDVSQDWDLRQSLLAIHKSQFSGPHLETIRQSIEDRSIREGAPLGFQEGEAFRCSRN